MLSGFIAPNGEYTPCEAYAHMATAAKIIEQLYPDEKQVGDYKNELLLTEQKDFLLLTSRGCSFAGKKLSSAQREFLENNLINANNAEQKDAIEFVLDVDDERNSHLGLSDYVDKNLGAFAFPSRGASNV